MVNIKSEVKGNMLTLTIDLSKTGKPSASGKNIVIASTQGNVPVPGKEDFKFGLNLYKAAE